MSAASPRLSGWRKARRVRQAEATARYGAEDDAVEVGLTLAAPADPAESAEVTRLAASLEGAYGKGKYCPETLAGAAKTCLDIEAITEIMATARIRPSCWMPGAAGTRFRRRCEGFPAVRGAVEQGRARAGVQDTGAMWRSKYDMPPDDFAKELDRLWEQVRPLYLSLHAYVRSEAAREVRRRGARERPDSRALLGKCGRRMGQRLSLVAPAGCRSGLRPDGDPEGAQDQALEDGAVRRELLHVAGLRSAAADVLGASPVRKPRIARWFATPAPGTWTTSNDLRIKMCIDITDEDFTTIHHELGHNFYQRAYNKQPFCSATAPTTASMRPSATPSRCR